MQLVSLSKLKKGGIGIIRQIDESVLPGNLNLTKGEIEDRLLEMGFIEGAQLKVMHVGIFGHDPVAVRINNSSSIIAMRKHEASAILVEIE